ASDSDEDNGEDARLTQPVDPRASAVQDNWIPMKTTAPGIADSTDSQQSPKQRPALVLVGWEILNRSKRAPKELFALIAYMVELQDHLGLDFADVRVWLPSAGLPADLAFAAKFNDARLLRSLFVQSIESESRFLWEFTTNPGSLARLAE